MKGLGQRAAQHINRTYRRTGTLFEGRFRSAVIETDSYLLACQRDIELNPVRAGMVRTPEDDPWSSYRCNALGAADPVIAPHPLYLDLADADPRRNAPAQIVGDPASDHGYRASRSRDRFSLPRFSGPKTKSASLTFLNASAPPAF